MAILTCPFSFFSFFFPEIKKYAAVRLGAVEVLDTVHSALQGFMTIFFFTLTLFLHASFCPDVLSHYLG